MFLFCLVFAMSLWASVYMCFVVTCWERADLLALVCGVYFEYVTFPLVSWVRCGTWLYRFLIFAPLLTFRSKQCGPRTDCSYRSSLIWVQIVYHRGFLNVSANEESRQLLLLLLFCCFTSKVNSYGHCRTVSSPNHTFSWAGLNKRITSNSCTYFRL